MATAHTEANAALMEILLDPLRRISALFSIPDKHNRVVPFSLWPNQKDFLERSLRPNASKRRVHLKPRQIGESAIIVAKNAGTAMTTPNVTVLVICQDGPTKALFRFHYKHHLKDLARRGLAPRVGEDNKDMLEFPDLGSRILFETAEGEAVGRAWTINYLHATEVAHWQHPVETLTGAMQSVPEGGEIDIESTPNGAGGVFHNIVKAAGAARKAEIGGRWELFFYPWWETAEYISGDDSPLYDLTTHEAWLMAEYKLTFAHIRWRRNKQEELSFTDKPFEQEYPEDPITCFAAGSRSPFKMGVIQRLLRDVRPPLFKGLPANDRDTFRKYAKNLWIWKEPQPGRDYIIPIDIAEGFGDDFTALPVLDYRTLEVVAAYYDNETNTVETAELANKLGYYYNTALLVPESNNMGYAVCKDLENKYLYPNLYYTIDPRHPETLGDAGWRTDKRTRPMMQSALMEHIPGGSVIIYDERGVQDLVSLVWRKDTEDARPRLEAMPGEHDDYAMALGIGLVARELQPPPAKESSMQPTVLRPRTL